jgi:hypothetical protein
MQKITQDEMEVKDLVPSMNVSLPEKSEDKALISDEQLLGIYGEIIETIRKDTREVDEILGNFINMVINEGESTTSARESLVNLVKIKTEQSDKMTRVADLMTRLKMKEKSTFPAYLSARQENTINIGTDKRALLEALEKAKKDVARQAS